MFNIEKLCFNCFHEKLNQGVCPYCGFDNLDNTEKYPGAMKIGSILNGQYVVGRILGQGGFGITYLAWDYQLDIKVAIKEYLPDGMAARLPGTTLVSVFTGEKKDNFDYGAECFLDEARVLAKFLGNKYIVGVKSYFRENNTAYFVMDYIEGINFKNYIKNHGGKIPYQDAMRVLKPVIDALAVVHGEGVVHRDVTPDNIYITKDNDIKLLDFGSARYSLGDKSRLLDVILKAGYAPKEQYIRKGKQGPYTDVYSLAACFYASITGYLPPEALERLENDELIPVSMCGISIPPKIEAAIMKGLEINAEKRFQSMVEFKTALLTEESQILGPNPVPAPILEPITVSEPIRVTVPEPITVQESELTLTLIQGQMLVQIPTVNLQTVSSQLPPQASSTTQLSDAIKSRNQTVLKEHVIQKIMHNSSLAEPANDMVMDRNDRRSLKSNIILVSAACVLVAIIVIGVILILNREDDNTYYTSGGGGAADASSVIINPGSNSEAGEESEEIAQGIPEVQTEQDQDGVSEAFETIELVVDSSLADHVDLITGAAQITSYNIEVICASNTDEFTTKVKTYYVSGTTSISMGYFNKTFMDDAVSSGASVKKSTILDGIEYIITGIDDTVASDIIAGLQSAEEVISDKIAEEIARAEDAENEKEESEIAAAEAAEQPEKSDNTSDGSDGKTKIAQTDNKCEYCDGTGKVECTWCDGTGICIIPHESEDGYVYEGNECTKTTECEWCDGTGKKKN